MNAYREAGVRVEECRCSLPVWAERVVLGVRVGSVWRCRGCLRCYVWWDGAWWARV